MKGKKRRDGRVGRNRQWPGNKVTPTGEGAGRELAVKVALSDGRPTFPSLPLPHH